MKTNEQVFRSSFALNSNARLNFRLHMEIHVSCIFECSTEKLRPVKEQIEAPMVLSRRLHLNVNLLNSHNASEVSEAGKW